MRKDSTIDKNQISVWLENQNPEIIQHTEHALEQFASCYQETPSLPIKNRILDQIANLNAGRQIIDLRNPPLLTEKSNFYDWNLALKGIKPPTDFEDIHLEPIYQDEKVQLFVAWVRKMVPEEVHHDLLESFMILEGSCTCHIKDIHGSTREVNMVAGDYITMQLGEEHDIEITSEKPTKAILQWLKIAA